MIIIIIYTAVYHCVCTLDRNFHMILKGAAGLILNTMFCGVRATCAVPLETAS